MTKLVEQIMEFGAEIKTVYLVSPNKGKAYAYVDFASPADAELFLEKARQVCNQNGSSLITGALGKRGAHYAKPQREEVACVLEESLLKYTLWNANEKML